ncbi:MAG: ribulose-phosphate 3-epimerase [Parcubacteria group bacterium]|nr:ribulose-phosphate 3-epimerase [Parcubacteria group bacterium]
MSDIEIIPAIIAKDYKEFEEKVKKVEPYVKWVHFDISDGIFTKNITFRNPKEAEKLKTKVKIEVHLMVSSPERMINDWLNTGIERILVHYESTRALRNILEKIRKTNIEAGVVLNLKTPVNILDRLLIWKDKESRPMVNAVQFMGIAKIGFYGAEFQESVLEKIKYIREKYPEVSIAIDGGVNLKNAKEIARAGVKRLVMGSAIFETKDIKKAIEGFKQII